MCSRVFLDEIGIRCVVHAHQGAVGHLNPRDAPGRVNRITEVLIETRVGHKLGRLGMVGSHDNQRLAVTVRKVDEESQGLIQLRHLRDGTAGVAHMTRLVDQCGLNHQEEAAAGVLGQSRNSTPGHLQHPRLPRRARVVDAGHRSREGAALAHLLRGPAVLTHHAGRKVALRKQAQPAVRRRGSSQIGCRGQDREAGRLRQCARGAITFSEILAPASQQQVQIRSRQLTRNGARTARFDAVVCTKRIPPHVPGRLAPTTGDVSHE